MRGRRPKPTHLKLLKGTAQKCRINPREPILGPGRPAKPRYLKGAASREWDRLVEHTLQLGVLSPHDGPMLEATVRAYEAMEQADSIIRERGITYSTITQTGGVMERPRPEVAVSADAWRRYVGGLSHFGLSPATRSKVSTIEKREDDAAAAYIRPV